MAIPTDEKDDSHSLQGLSSLKPQKVLSNKMKKEYYYTCTHLKEYFNSLSDNCTGI